MKMWSVFKIYLTLALILSVFLLSLVFLGLIEPAATPQNIFFTNLTDHQATITWTTAKPTRSLIIASKDGKFPLLPLAIFGQAMSKDDGEKLLSKQGFYTTHHVTVEKLDPNTTYYFRIYQGLKNIYQGKFTTGPTLTTLTAPNPIYGRVLTSDKKPAAGALVYFQEKQESSPSALLSTLTNQQGRWSLDLGNLRSANLKTSFPAKAKNIKEIVVEAGSKGKVKFATTSAQLNPAPDILLK